MKQWSYVISYTTILSERHIAFQPHLATQQEDFALYWQTKIHPLKDVHHFFFSRAMSEDHISHYFQFTTVLNLWLHQLNTWRYTSKDELVPHTSTIEVIWTINLPPLLASLHFLPQVAPAMSSGYSIQSLVLNWKWIIHQPGQQGLTGLSWSLSIAPWTALMCLMHDNVGSSK